MLRNCRPLRMTKMLRSFCMDDFCEGGVGPFGSCGFVLCMSKARPAMVWNIVEPVCSSYTRPCVGLRFNEENGFNKLLTLLWTPKAVDTYFRATIFGTNTTRSTVGERSVQRQPTYDIRPTRSKSVADTEREYAWP